MKSIKKLFLLFFVTTSLIAGESILDEIEKTKKIKVCVWPEYYGISFLDQRTQQFSGIDSDLAKELAKDLKAELKDHTRKMEVLDNTTPLFKPRFTRV